MFRIAICDDSMIQQGMVRELLQTYGEKNNKELSVDVYNNATALLSYVEQNGGYDMYVLDIVMEGVKGNELAGILRGRGDKIRPRSNGSEKAFFTSYLLICIA